VIFRCSFLYERSAELSFSRFFLLGPPRVLVWSRRVLSPPQLRVIIFFTKVNKPPPPPKPIEKSFRNPTMCHPPPTREVSNWRILVLVPPQLFPLPFPNNGIFHNCIFLWPFFPWGIVPALSSPVLFSTGHRSPPGGPTVHRSPTYLPLT